VKKNWLLLAALVAASIVSVLLGDGGTVLPPF
jgi:hypothetical protein